MRWRARDAPVDREIRGIAPLTQVPIQQIRCARQMVDLKTEKAEREGSECAEGRSDAPVSQMLRCEQSTGRAGSESGQ